MATPFFYTSNYFLSSNLPTSTTSPSSTPPTIPIFFCSQKYISRRHHVTLCKASSETQLPTCPVLTKRRLSICFFTSFVFPLAGRGVNSIANAAILEADDDEELLEKVKRDRKKRLERQGVISSSDKETGYLQDLVYKLSKVGQAIDNNDLSAASSVLGGSMETDWVQKANVAFNKLSSSAEEKTQVNAFNSSLASLISSVTSDDIESSKINFVSSATAFEKWTNLTGIFSQLKGL